MRLRFLAHVAALAVSTAIAQRPATFPSIPWNTSVGLVRRTVRLESLSADGGRTRFLAEVGRLGDAWILECTFEFVMDRFAGVTLMTRGRENTAALRSYLVSRLGPPHETEIRWCQWIVGGTYVSLDEDSAGDGYVLWYCIPCQRLDEK